jgi:hypothetical protein
VACRCSCWCFGRDADVGQVPRKGVYVIGQPMSFTRSRGAMSGKIVVVPSLPPTTRRTGGRSTMLYSMPSDMNSRLLNLIIVPSLNG